MTNHALNRIKERYGRTLNYKELAHIEKCLRNDYGILLEEGIVENSKVVLVMYDHIPYKFVYNPKKHVIITALPLNIDELNNFMDKLQNIESISSDRNNLADSEYLKNILLLKHQKYAYERKNSVKHIIIDNKRVHIEGKRGNLILFWYRKDYKTINYFIRNICELEDELLNVLKPYLHSNNIDKVRQVNNLLNRILNVKQI